MRNLILTLLAAVLVQPLFSIGVSTALSLKDSGTDDFVLEISNDTPEAIALQTYNARPVVEVEVWRANLGIRCRPKDQYDVVQWGGELPQDLAEIPPGTSGRWEYKVSELSSEVLERPEWRGRFNFDPPWSMAARVSGKCGGRWAEFATPLIRR